MNFESLVGHINQVQDVLQAQAAHAVNQSLTARNWLMGYYIVEHKLTNNSLGMIAAEGLGAIAALLLAA